MKQSFLPNPSEEAKVPVSPSIASKTPNIREPIKHLLVGSPKGVRNTIHTLHVRGYAEVSEWSPPQPTANPNEVMSILVRYIVL